MQTFKITKRQIEDLANLDELTAHFLKQWFSEAFKAKLEIGKWYKTDPLVFHNENRLDQKATNPLLLCYSGIEESSNYGISFLGNWITQGSIYEKDLGDYLHEATDEEIEKALIAEAEKRYNLGDQIIWLDKTKPNKLLGFCLTFKNNTLSASENSRDILFKDGKWAEIAEPLNFDWSCLPAWSNKAIAISPEGNWYHSDKTDGVMWKEENRIHCMYWPINYKGDNTKIHLNPNF